MFSTLCNHSNLNATFLFSHLQYLHFWIAAAEIIQKQKQVAEYKWNSLTFSTKPLLFVILFGSLF